MVAPAAARAGEVTRLLHAARAGDASAIDRIVPLVYEDLRRVARRQLGRGFGNESVRPTELVHDAYVKLSVGGAAAAEDRSHFLAIAARAMRQVLVDDARHRLAAKRGGITFMNTSDARNDTTIALNSLHALMRHQYQRRISTSPVPAPIASRNFHAFSTDESCEVTMIESRKSTIVAARPTFT